MQLQYIGARYVPVWYKNSLDDSANWENNVEYEPLTFVTSQNNHLYLSKKTVPDNIGTPADNTEYWLDMGVFSGSYADLVAMIGDLSELETTDKSNLVAAINEVSGNKDVLYPEDYGAVGDGVTDDTEAFKACIDDAQNKKVVLRNSYLITERVTIKSNTKIIGGRIIDGIAADPDASVGDTSLFYLNNAKHVTIANVEFSGGTATQYDGTENYKHDLIVVDNSKFIDIINNNFSAVNAFRDIVTHGSEGVHVDFNMFYYARYAAVAFTDKTKYSTIRYNVYLELGITTRNSYAFIFSTADLAGDYSTNYCTNIDVVGNYIEYKDTTSLWESISAHGAYYCNIVRNRIMDCLFGISMSHENVRNFQSYGCLVEDNYIKGRDGTDLPASFGIAIGGTYNQIKNNILINCGKVSNSDSVLGNNSAILFLQMAAHTVIEGNLFKNSGGYVCMFSGTGSNAVGYNKVIIKNNTFDIVAFGGGGRGIVAIDSTALLTATIEFVDNLVETGGVDPVFIGSAGTATYDKALTILNNKFSVTPSYTNPGNIVTDYVNTIYASQCTLGFQGMTRKYWNATTAGNPAFAIYTDAWHVVNLS